MSKDLRKSIKSMILNIKTTVSRCVCFYIQTEWRLNCHETGAPGLQVAMETQKDALGVTVKVKQLGDQSCQTAELIDLQDMTTVQSFNFIMMSLGKLR